MAAHRIARKIASQFADFTKRWNELAQVFNFSEIRYGLLNLPPSKIYRGNKNDKIFRLFLRSNS